VDNPEKLAKLGTQDTERRQTKQKDTPLCANKHNVNKTWSLLQTTGGKDERNLVFLRKSQRTSQHGTKNVKTHNRTDNTQTNKISYTI